MDLVEEDTSDVPVQVGFTQCKLLLVIVSSVFQTYKFHRIGDLDQINLSAQVWKLTEYQGEGRGAGFLHKRPLKQSQSIGESGFSDPGAGNI